MKITKKWPKFISWFLTKPKTSGFLVFLILSIIVAYIVLQRYEIIKENEHREMNNILEVAHQNIEQSLKNCYTTTLTLALTINDNGYPENFNPISSQLLESNASISAVQLVPDGVIKYIYPMEGNEAAMNLNILNSQLHKTEALKSIKNQKMYFAGPLVLKQGGMGIVGRLPVYKKTKFWGFSAVIIKLETLLKVSGINTVDHTKYYFQFSKINPVTQNEDFFLPSQGDFSENYYISTKIPDGGWKLYLIDKKQHRNYTMILLPAILGFILALSFGIFVTMLLKIPRELQILVRKQAKRILNNERKFKTIFDQASVGIALVDANSGNYIEINKQYCAMLGCNPQEIKEENFQTVIHPDNLSYNSFNMEKSVAKKSKGYSKENRHITKSGKKVWLNLTVTPLWETNKKSNTNIVIIEDITLQKETAEIIQKNETRFKSLFDDSPIPLWEEDFSEVKKHLKELNLMNENPEIVSAYFNENMDVVYKCISLIKVIGVNNACLKLHEVKTKEELITSLNQIIDIESINDLIIQLTAITQGDNQLIIDSKIKTHYGESRDINLRWNVIHGYEETLERIIVSTEDITMRKSSEKTIINSQQKIESLINTIDGIVWECDAETLSFTFISEKVENILGYSAEEWVSNPTFWADHIHPEDREWALNYCTLKTKQNLNHDFEYRMIDKNGSLVWLRDIVNVVIENKKAVSLRGIMIDITKSKKAEKELNDSFNLVIEQNKRLLNFSYIVSHNLRSHTSNITSIMTLIESSKSEEEKDQMVQLLKSVSNSLSETMLHLNEVINIHTNISLVSESLNLKQYIDNTISIFSEQITAKNVSISNTVPDEVIVNYNPAYLESILFNIISNAIRYIHPDRKPIIVIKWIKENGKKALQISDNGIGIDLIKNGNKIFGMYKTFSNNLESKGIGLFITKNQIDSMGGTITVESEPNVGTTFKIFIQ